MQSCRLRSRNFKLGYKSKRYSHPALTPNLLNEPILESQVTSAASDAPDRSRQALWLLLGSAVVMLVAIAALLLLRHPDPYVRSVLALEGNPSQGQVIFQMNCATCHGLTGDGVVGPSLHHVSARKSRIKLIEQVISGKTPPMPQFQPNAQEMADLLEYLESL
ncbi:Cytochrome c [Leptolyngbya sp. O-77]|nr:Cytochrome c [Leptolyngbya sp. O-77]